MEISMNPAPEHDSKAAVNVIKLFMKNLVGWLKIMPDRGNRGKKFMLNRIKKNNLNSFLIYHLSFHLNKVILIYYP